MRYNKNSGIQPTRVISNSANDIPHTLTQGETISKLAYKYYDDPNLSWIIMCANPQYFNEWEINIGDNIRIPYPLDRVKNEWNLKEEL